MQGRLLRGARKGSYFVINYAASPTTAQPTTWPGGTFDWDAGAQYARLNFLVGYQGAQAVRRPSWNKGNFFGGRFGK